MMASCSTPLGKSSQVNFERTSKNPPEVWIWHVGDACSPDPITREPWVQERGVSVLGDYWTCMTTGKELLMHESNQKIACARRQLYHAN